MPPQQTTPTVSSSGSDDRQLTIVRKVFGCLHLVLNLICASIAGTDYNWHTTIKRLTANGANFYTLPDRINRTAEEVGLGPGQTSARLFFLVVTMIHMFVSFVLLIWHWIIEHNRSIETTLLKPIYVFIFYLIGSVSLFIASIVLLVSIRAREFVFFDNGMMNLAASLEICNGFFYLGNAFILWRFWKRA